MGLGAPHPATPCSPVLAARESPSAPYIVASRCGTYQRAAAGERLVQASSESCGVLRRDCRRRRPRLQAPGPRAGARRAGQERGPRALQGWPSPRRGTRQPRGQAQPGPYNRVGQWPRLGRRRAGRKDRGRSRQALGGGYCEPAGYQPSQPRPSPELPSLRVVARRAGPGVMRRGTPILAAGRRRRRR